MLLRMSSLAFGFALLLPLAAALLHTAKLSAPHGVSIVNAYCTHSSVLTLWLLHGYRAVLPKLTTELAPGCQQSKCHTESASYDRSPSMLHTWKERKARQELGEDAGQAPDIDAWPIWQPQ